MYIFRYFIGASLGVGLAIRTFSDTNERLKVLIDTMVAPTLNVYGII